MPILILTTLRPPVADTPLARDVERIQRESIGETLELGGLPETDVHDLITAMGYSRPSQQLVSTVALATEGNPLFVQEAMHHLERTGADQQPR